MANDTALTAGLTLADAAKRFATDERVGRLWHAHFLRWQIYRTELSDEQREELAQSWIDVETDLRRQFESGALGLAGYNADAVVLTCADRNWSLLADLDPFHDLASDGHVILRSVRLFPAVEAEAKDALPRPKPRRRSAATLRREFAAWIRSLGKGNEPTKAAAEQWAKDRQVSIAAARKLQQELVGRSPGRPIKVNGRK
jgi:hypothetical protein